MYFDPLYIILALPGLLLSILASMFVKIRFSTYSRVMSRRGMTGAQAAEAMLRAAGIYDVNIRTTRGYLSDHYDPRDKSLNLSSDVYNSSSLAAIGVACHEAGHAIQHAMHYAPLDLRTFLVLPANIGSQFFWIFIVLGALLQFQGLIYFGLALFCFAVFFTLVTLPVEWDASARAKVAMVRAGFLTDDEQRGAAKVLNAAFMTYVAAAASALLTLLYWLIRLGLIGGRRRD